MGPTWQPHGRNLTHARTGAAAMESEGRVIVGVMALR